MNEKAVKRLYDMEFDEVSMVDRPANQFSTIAISKADEDDVEGVEIFTEEGEAIDLDDLDHGDLVYNEDGEEFVVVDEDAEVEKSATMASVGSIAALPGRLKGMGRAAQRGYANPNQVPEGASRARRVGAHVGRNKVGYAAGTGATVGATGGFAAGRTNKDGEMSKSLGDALLEELSKAASEDERSEIVAAAMGEVEIAKAAAAEAMAIAERERDLRTTDMFIAKAAEYNVPVAPEVLGPILKSVATVLDEDQLEVLDQLLIAVGEELFDEIGFAGENDNNSVLDQVNAYASEYVGKADVSGAQAIADIFDANPEAYDAYLQEKGI